MEHQEIINPSEIIYAITMQSILNAIGQCLGEDKVERSGLCKKDLFQLVDSSRGAFIY